MAIRKKVALFCNVNIKNVIQSIDVSTIYEVPIKMQEEELDKKILINLSNLQYTEADKITFRYKERLSMIIFDNEKLGQIRLDLTIVKFSNSPDNLHYADKEFEIELEYSKGTEDISDKILKKLIIFMLVNTKRVVAC